MLNTILGLGLALQLPVILVLLSKFGIIRTSSLISYRKHVIVFCFVTAAFITPPDLISHIILGTSMVVLYEVSILVSKIAEKYQQN